MKPAGILFEKIIQDGSIPNETLIIASENRRSFMRVKQLGRNSRTEAIAYYDSFVDLLDLMKQNNTSLYRQPLFQWNNHGSNSFLYEKMNLEHSISQDCLEAAETTDLKEKKRILGDSVRFIDKLVLQREESVMDHFIFRVFNLALFLHLF